MMPYRAKNIFLAALAVAGSACGAQASKPKNTTGNSAGLPGIVEKAPGQFPSPLPGALESLSSHMVIPVLAPRVIPPNLSARTTSAESGYSVTLYRCQSEFPLNSPEIGNPPDCSGLTRHFGDFGATRYPSAAAARLAMATWKNRSTRFCAPNPASSQQLSLAPGVQGAILRAKGVFGYCEMRFVLRGWSVLIGGDASLFSIAEAKKEGLRVVEFMTEARIPVKDGTVVVQTAGDGNHTWLTWTIGRNLYSVGGYRSTSAAFAMAGSMTLVGGAAAQ